MVMVHTAWCGHCKRMKPDYILAADELQEKKSGAKLGPDYFTFSLQLLGAHFAVNYLYKINLYIINRIWSFLNMTVF